MLIKSFLAIPHGGQFQILRKTLDQFSNCEVISPSQGEQAFVVIMENEDQHAEDEFLQVLHKAEGLQHLNLVSSFNDGLN